MKSLYSLLFIFFAIPLHAQTIGFSAGDIFNSVDLRGTIQVNCQDGMQNQTNQYSCHGNALEPAEASYFMGPAGVSAAKVHLAARHEDGRIVEKNRSYDSSQGRSEAVNLWIASVFQTPLLDFGVNSIEFSLLDQNGAAVSSGEFQARVDRGAPRHCRFRYYYSNNINDCNNAFTMCQRYFFDENDCL